MRKIVDWTKWLWRCRICIFIEFEIMDWVKLCVALFLCYDWTEPPPPHTPCPDKVKKLVWTVGGGSCLSPLYSPSTINRLAKLHLCTTLSQHFIQSVDNKLVSQALVHYICVLHYLSTSYSPSTINWLAKPCRSCWMVRQVEELRPRHIAPNFQFDRQPLAPQLFVQIIHMRHHPFH